MTSHELARKLLEGEDLPIEVLMMDADGPVGSIATGIVISTAERPWGRATILNTVEEAGFLVEDEEDDDVP